MLKKLSWVLLAFSAMCLFSSCEKDETHMTCSVEYDFRLPDPLLEIADAYVEYTDNGQSTTELMKDGKWSKKFSYKWTGEAANEIDYGFNTLKIILKPKVSPDSFKAGAQLLKDSKAYFTFVLNYTFVNKSENSFSGTSSNVTNSGTSGGGPYHLVSDVQNYKYSINEQIEWFNSQDTDPFWDIKWDHKGAKCDIEVSSNVGIPNLGNE